MNLVYRTAWELTKGIRYRVRHDQSEIAVALFDRAADAVTAEVMSELTSDPALASTLARYNVALI